MTIGHLTSREQTKVIKATSATNDVRTLIANHLGVSVRRVTDDAHLADDLGADWLDRLDLMIAVEDQFAGVEITDDDVDRIELVGDLIRHIETLDSERRRRGAAPVFRNLFGPHVARYEANQAAKRLRRSSSVIFEARGRPDAQSHWLVP
jgi:acyl carrier protein